MEYFPTWTAIGKLVQLKVTKKKNEHSSNTLKSLLQLFFNAQATQKMHCDISIAKIHGQRG